MSTTTILAPSAAPTSLSVFACPRCGTDLSKHPTNEESHRRIVELENQVKILSGKAAAAVDRLADYEDEVRHLRKESQSSITNGPAASQSHSRQTSANGLPTTEITKSPTPPPQSAPTTTAARLAGLASYLPGRRPSPLNSTSNTAQPGAALASPALPPMPTTPHTPSFFSLGNSSSSDLSSQLNQERSLRQKLESQLAASSTELEELTAQLFSQANEMVASERKARAKLEERVKILESRDGEKRERLKRLEDRMGRVERVRGLLGMQS